MNEKLNQEEINHIKGVALQMGAALHPIIEDNPYHVGIMAIPSSISSLIVLMCENDKDLINTTVEFITKSIIYYTNLELSNDTD